MNARRYRQGPRDANLNTQGQGRAESEPESLPQLPGHPPTDLKRRIAATQSHEVLPLGSALDSFQMADADERVAMDTDKVRIELLLQRAQGVLDEVFAIQMPHRRVLLLREKVLHFLNRNEVQSLAPASSDVSASFVVVGGSGKLL